MDDSPPVPRSSSDGERRPGGTESQRRWIWRDDDENGQGAEVEGVTERGTGGVRGFACKVEIKAEFDCEFGVVAAAVTWVGCGKTFVFGAEFVVGVVMWVEGMERTETRAEDEDEAEIVKEIVWCPLSLSGYY